MASQRDDIKTSLLRKNTDFFAKYGRDDINTSIRSSKFTNEFKMQTLYKHIKRCQSYLRKIIDLSAFSQTFLRFMKDVYTIK